MGSTTVGSDGSVFTQIGSFSIDGSTGMGSTSIGIGAVFNVTVLKTRLALIHKTSMTSGDTAGWQPTFNGENSYD